METLAFYSYKGGVGRSQLLAKAARFLASQGKGVLALDLDFEAPGLHYNLGHPARGGGPEGAGGAVPYLVSAASQGTSPPALDEHIVEVSIPMEQPHGWLQLMPAGPAPGRVYWAALKQLGEQVRFDDPSGQGLLPILDLQARIEDELKPDYLLIDVQTGVTELGGVATTILADTVVCMFVASQESLDGTLTVVEALKVAPRLKGQRPLLVVPLLARTTSEPPEEGPFAAGVKRLLKLVEGDVSDGKQHSKLLILPQEEAKEAASSFSPLDRSYFELFQTLFLSSAKGVYDALPGSMA